MTTLRLLVVPNGAITLSEAVVQSLCNGINDNRGLDTQLFTAEA